MIVQAYARRRQGGAAARCSPTTCSHGFAGAIDQRSADGQTLDTQLIAIESAEVVEAGMQGRLARVSVRFASEQVNVVRDADGNVIDGDPTTAEEVVDIWTFERDTRSRDPNWTLVETRTPQLSARPTRTLAVAMRLATGVPTLMVAARRHWR